MVFIGPTLMKIAVIFIYWIEASFEVGRQSRIVLAAVQQDQLVGSV